MQARGRIEDQVLCAIFGDDCGRLISDFSCAYERGFLKQGRLYVTTRFVCFYSNLFGFEEKLRIPLARVSGISKERTALLIDNAIFVTSSDSSTYQFRSFWDRDECFLLLEKCWRVNGKGALSFLVPDHLLIEAPAPLRRRRSESHPNLPSFASESPLKRSLSAESLSGRPANDANVAVALSATSPSASEASNMLRSVRSASDLITQPAPSAEDLLVAEESDRRNIAARFEADLAELRFSVPIAETELPLSVGDFFGSFLADGAALGWPAFQTSMQEKDVEAGLWERCRSASTGGDCGEVLAMARTISFEKPINAFGFVSTRATKHQVLRIYPGLGLVLSSRTRLDPSSGIPAASCFSLVDALLLREVSPDSVLVSLSFELQWHQSSVLRLFVSSATNKETIVYLSRYFAFVSERRVSDQEGQEGDQNHRGRSEGGEKRGETGGEKHGVTQHEGVDPFSSAEMHSHGARLLGIVLVVILLACVTCQPR